MVCGLEEQKILQSYAPSLWHLVCDTSVLTRAVKLRYVSPAFSQCLM